MLGFPPYYHRAIRKCVVAFGTIFNELVLVKYLKNSSTEVSRITVPLSYEGKEDFITRLVDNPDLAKPVQITLPRMSFFINSYNFDPQRKTSDYNYQTVGGSGGSAQQIYAPVPWNLGFELNLYVRNVEDGTQLIEQILPFFTPDYTVTINYVPEMGISRNAPIVLDSVNCSTEYEGDSSEAERTIIWTLGFTMQAYIYGPIETGNTITDVKTNIFINTSLGGGSDALASDVELTLVNSGFGSYTLGETVYQGANLPDSLSNGPYGTVSNWNATGHTLTLSNVNGFFQASSNVVGANSQASWGVAQTSPNILMAAIEVTPKPNTANANDDFGFSTYITEYPQTVDPLS